MKNLKIFYIVFTIFQIIIINNTKAQDVLEKIPPSPDIAALGKFIDVPVSYYTGIPEITIPIHTLTEGSLSLPISLDYHAGGIKVNEVASRVGLGWALNAGGVIARSVQGLPDESANGFFNKGKTLDLSCGNADIDAIGKGELDGEPDIFSFMIPGYAGKFYFNSDRQPVQIVHSDLKIVLSADFNKFEITTPKGTIYTFNTKETNTIVGTSAWLLDKIESYNKTESIEFEYDNENHAIEHKGNWNCIENIHEKFYVYTRGKNLKSIRSEYEIISFKYDYANDIREDIKNWSINPPPVKLSSIEIRNGVNQFCKEFKLSHNYFTSGETEDEKRLRLDGLQEISCDGNTVIPPYSFEYFDDEALPHRLSTAMDHWGFFNGVGATNTGALLPGEVDMDYEINGSSMKPLIPKESIGNIADIYAGLNACDITPILPGDFPDVFTNLLPPELSSLIGLTLDGSKFTYSPTVNSTDPRAPDFAFMQLGALQRITYPNGGTHKFEYEANQHSNDGSNTTAGGLRIKQITLSPKKNAKDEIVKTYSYTEKNNSTSSGVLYQMPVYDVVWGEILSANKPSCTGSGSKSLDNQFVIPIRIRVADNIMPLNDYEGVHIGYSRVTETIAGENRVLEFETEEIASDTPFNKGDSFTDFDTFAGGEVSFPPAPAQARVNAGTLLKESVSNVDGTLVSEIEYKINTDDTYTKSSEAFAKVFTADIASLSINDFLDPLFSVLEEPIKKVVSNFEFPNLGDLKLSNHIVNSYKIRSKPHRISSRSATLDGVTTLTKYTYGQEAFVDNVTMIEKGINADKNGTFDNTAEVLKTEFKYIWEKQPTLGFGILVRNMVGLIGETKTTINNNAVSGNRTDYKFDAANQRFLQEKMWAIQGDDPNIVDDEWKIQEIVTLWNVRGYKARYKRAKSGATKDSKENDATAYDQNYFNITYDTYGYLPRSTTSHKSNSITLKKIYYQYYNNSNVLYSTTDQNEISTVYTYDDLLRPTKIEGDKSGSNPAEVITDFKYEYQFFTNNPFGNCTHKNVSYADEALANGAKSLKTITYIDGLGRTTDVYRAKGNILEDRIEGIIYNNAGLAKSRWDWNTGTETTYDYESVFLNRMQSITAPEGTTLYTYSANAITINIGSGTAMQSYGANHLNKTRLTDIDGNTTDTFTDYRGNTVMEVGAAGDLTATTKYLYNKQNQLVEVFPPLKENSNNIKTQGNIYEYSYNERGLLKDKKMPSSDFAHSYSYDELDRLQSITDPNFKVTIYEYNEVDMLVKTGKGQVFTNKTTIEEGKELSEFIYKTNTGGSYKTWLHSEAHAILDGSEPHKMATTTYTIYDKVGRPTQSTTSGIFSGKQDVYNMTYNNAGQMLTKGTSIAKPNGTAPLQSWTHQYDEYNRIKDVAYNDKTLFANRYEVKNNRLLSKYLEPIMSTANQPGSCLQAIDYFYDDPAKRLTSINSIADIGKRSTNAQQPIQCKIAFEMPVEQGAQGYLVEDLYFNNTNAKTESLQQWGAMNFPYYITENNDSGFIEDLKSILLSKGYIFNDVYLQFGEQLILNFEQTNFLAHTIAYNKKTLGAFTQNCCFDGSTGGAIINQYNETSNGSGKLNNCQAAVITNISRHSNEPFVKFELDGTANEVIVQYKVAEATTWSEVKPENNNARLKNMIPCRNYEVRIKTVCDDVTTFSATQCFKSFGCFNDCIFENFGAKVRNTTSQSAVITFSNVWGATYTFHYWKNGESESSYVSYFPQVILFGLEPGAEYNFYVTVNCSNLKTDRAPKTGYFTFTTEDEPLLQLVPEKDLFAQELSYTGSNIFTNQWQTLQRKDNNQGAEGFIFSYDKLNRMTDAKQLGINFPIQTEYNTNVTYDLRGNIKSLSRGSSVDNSTIDNLTYTYHDKLDRLISIAEKAKADRGFVMEKRKDANETVATVKTTAEYEYHLDGSIKKEQNKLLKYEYNHLNMPKKIIQLDVNQNPTNNFIEIVYLGNGEKLSMRTFQNNVEVNTVYYRDNTEIRNGDVIVNHSDGRVVYPNGGGTGEYQYYLKDHLGNVRLTVSGCPEPLVCKNALPSIISENHYYPFGLKMEGDWNANNTADPKVTDQYNGKEWVDDLDLNMNDYGARWYDPAVARWSSVDPLAEKYLGHSPYNYVLGNPVKYIDPDGRDVWERDNSTGFSRHISTFGGDEIDFIYNVDIDESGNTSVTSIDTKSVSYRQGGHIDFFKEPGLRILPRAGDGIQSVAYETFFLPLPKIAWGTSFAKWFGFGSKSLTKGGDELVTVYRGVNSTAGSAYKNALNGVVKPRGGLFGHTNALKHNIRLNGTVNSRLTSWTTNIDVALNYAYRTNGTGVLLKMQVPKSILYKSPNLKKVNLFHKPGIVVSESEWLLKGTFRKVDFKKTLFK